MKSKELGPRRPPGPNPYAPLQRDTEGSGPKPIRKELRQLTAGLRPWHAGQAPPPARGLPISASYRLPPPACRPRGAAPPPTPSQARGKAGRGQHRAGASRAEVTLTEVPLTSSRKSEYAPHGKTTQRLLQKGKGELESYKVLLERGKKRNPYIYVIYIKNPYSKKISNF